ncbi:MAG TPA: RluA family pseudouridine synthase [Saprospiraceae bacterium]|nr:RluA family pseudouridine synthase [Saprospiraceae bacterium]
MIQVIFEDNHLIAVNKEAGILVHADETGDYSLDEMVKNYIKVRYGKPGDVYLATLHRIDRPVSGVVIFARTSKAAERMTKLFQTHAIDKNYLAITNNRPEPLAGRLTHYLIKNTETNIVKAYPKPKGDAKEAILDYEFVGQVDRSHILLKVNILTGRPHQIRVQLAKINCPIQGDLKYGAEYANPDKSISLHCRSMSFIHPVLKTPVKITADVPHNPIWRDYAPLINHDRM